MYLEIKMENLMFRISVWVYALFLLLCSVAMAAQQPAAVSANAVVPSVVNFSGVLMGVNGKPLTGTVGVTFYLYQDSQGGAPLWMETQNVQPDKFGHYSVALGSASSQGLPANVFATGEARWLGVQVHGRDEEPRVLLMSVPYALKALDAETIGGKPASAFMMAPTSNSKSEAPVLPPGTITGSGTADFVPMFTGATTIGNSKIFQTVGGNVGIATTTPAAKLDISGTGDVRDTLTLFPKSTHPTLSVHGTAFEVSSTGKVTFVSGQTFPGTGTVTSVASGAGLTGGPITHSGTLSIASGGVTNAMLSHSSLTVTAKSPLTGGGPVSLGGSTSLGLKSCGSNQILEFVSSAWTCVAIPVGTISGVTAGTDLTGGGSSGKVTLNLDTAKVPQLAAANNFTNTNSINVSSGDDIDLTNSGDGNSITMSIGFGIGAYVSGNGQGYHADVGGDGGAFTSSGADGSYNLGGGGGVYAESDFDNSFNTGATAFEFGTTEEDIGVWAFSDSPAGMGVYGETVLASVTTPLFNGTSGVWGDSSANVAVNGTSDSNYGVVGATSDTSGLGYAGGLFLNYTSKAGDAVLYTYAPNVGGRCVMDTSGNLACTGSKSAVVPVDGGTRKVALYAIEGPENWFEDAGSGHLSNGEAVVNLEGTFGQTVNTDIEYHVFLTPNGDCKGLYVAQKSPTSFVVRELGGGTSSIDFDYRIMAKRKGYENIRLEDRTKLFAGPAVKPGLKPVAKPPNPHEVREKHAAMARRVAQVTRDPLKKVN
jgi:hypothetical protein